MPRQQLLPSLDGVLHVGLVRADAHVVEQPLGVPGGHVQPTLQRKLRRRRHVDRKQVVRPAEPLGSLGQGRLDPANQLGEQRRVLLPFAGRKEERRTHRVQLEAVDLRVQVGELDDPVEEMPADHVRRIVQAAAVVSVFRAEGQLGVLFPELADVGVLGRGEMGVVHAEAGQDLLAQLAKDAERRPEVAARLGGEVVDVPVDPRPFQIAAGGHLAIVDADAASDRASATTCRRRNTPPSRRPAGSSSANTAADRPCPDRR